MLRGVLLFVLLLQATGLIGVNGFAYRRATTKEDGYRLTMVELEQERASAARIAFATRSSASSSETFVRRPRKHLEDQLQAQSGLSDRVTLQSATRGDHSAYSSRLLEMSSWEIGKSKLVKATLLLVSGCVGVATITYLGILCCQTRGQSPTAKDGQPNGNQPVQSCDNATSEKYLVKSEDNVNTADARRGNFANNRGATYVDFEDPPDPSPQSLMPGTGSQSVLQNVISFTQNRGCTYANAEDLAPKMPPPLSELRSEMKRESFAEHRGGTYQVFDNANASESEYSVPKPRHDDPQLTPGRLHEEPLSTDPFHPYNNLHVTPGRSHEEPVNTVPFQPSEMKRESFAEHRGGTYQVFNDDVESASELSVTEPRHDDPQLTPGRLHEEPLSTDPFHPYNNLHVTPGRSHEEPVNTVPFQPPQEAEDDVKNCAFQPQSSRCPMTPQEAEDDVKNCAFQPQSSRCPMTPQEAEDDVKNCAFQPQSSRCPMTRQGTFTIGKVDVDDPDQPLILPTLRKSTNYTLVIQCTDADGINDNGLASADAVHNGILIQTPRHSDNLDRSPSPRRVHFANEPTVRYKSQDSDETDGRRTGDEQTANKRMAFAQARHSVHYDETFDKLNSTTTLP